MRTIILTIACLISFLSCTKAIKKNDSREDIAHTIAYYNADTLNRHKQEFSSFITQFDLYEKKTIDKSFFLTRKPRDGEMYTEITEFSSFIPYDNTCNCEREELYYRPCYKIDMGSFYIVGIHGSCDYTTTPDFPYDVNVLVSYNKDGNIIDFAVFGYSSDFKYDKLETTEKKNVLKVTQYSFNVEGPRNSVYSGPCEVSEYTITVNDDGTIDKDIIREYTDNVTLSLDYLP